MDTLYIVYFRKLNNQEKDQHLINKQPKKIYKGVFILCLHKKNCLDMVLTKPLTIKPKLLV